MRAGRAYDAIALRYEQRKQAAAPAAWSEHLLGRWSQALPPPRRVLELGCGHGFEAARMRDDGLRPIGLDLSSGMLRLAQQRVTGPLVQGDATRLPFGTATFDGVWSLHALLHVRDLPVALGEVARVLKPGGLGALTVAVGQGETVEPVPYQPDVVRRFVHWSEETVLDLVEAADLRVLDTGLDTDGRSTLWLLTARREVPSADAARAAAVR